MSDASSPLRTILDPAYASGLDSRETADLERMRAECAEVENELSYVRRLAQGRVEILEAEVRRRAEGGSLDELVAKLPEILAGHETRPPATGTRIPPRLVPVDAAAVLAPDDERLLADDTLANLPTLSDADLERGLEAHRALERRVSDDRRALHEVMDRIERDLAGRRVGRA